MQFQDQSSPGLIPWVALEKNCFVEIVLLRGKRAGLLYTHLSPTYPTYTLLDTYWPWAVPDIVSQASAREGASFGQGQALGEEGRHELSAASIRHSWGMRAGVG